MKIQKYLLDRLSRRTTKTVQEDMGRDRPYQCAPLRFKDSRDEPSENAMIFDPRSGRLQCCSRAADSSDGVSLDFRLLADEKSFTFRFNEMSMGSPEREGDESLGALSDLVTELSNIVEVSDDAPRLPKSPLNSYIASPEREAELIDASLPAPPCFAASKGEIVDKAVELIGPLFGVPMEIVEQNTVTETRDAWNAAALTLNIARHLEFIEHASGDGPESHALDYFDSVLKVVRISGQNNGYRYHTLLTVPLPKDEQYCRAIGANLWPDGEWVLLGDGYGLVPGQGMVIRRRVKVDKAAGVINFDAEASRGRIVYPAYSEICTSRSLIDEERQWEAALLQRAESKREKERLKTLRDKVLWTHQSFASSIFQMMTVFFTSTVKYDWVRVLENKPWVIEDDASAKSNREKYGRCQTFCLSFNSLITKIWFDYASVSSLETIHACEKCGHLYASDRGDRKYCSNRCKRAAEKSRERKKKKAKGRERGI